MPRKLPAKSKINREEYRGYLIQVRAKKKLHAIILDPDGLGLPQMPEATQEEGRAVLMMRAHAAVDAELERTTRRVKSKA